MSRDVYVITSDNHHIHTHTWQHLYCTKLALTASAICAQRFQKRENMRITSAHCCSRQSFGDSFTHVHKLFLFGKAHKEQKKQKKVTLSSTNKFLSPLHLWRIIASVKTTSHMISPGKFCQSCYYKLLKVKLSFNFTNVRFIVVNNLFHVWIL